MSLSDEFENLRKGWDADNAQEQQIPESLKKQHYIPPPIDPWKHRNKGMRCMTCMWFVTKENNVGRCRRHAPTMSGYPVVFNTDWCGDHKLDETKASI